MSRRFNERGEIINSYSVSEGTVINRTTRSNFLTTTLIVSPVIYAIVGITLNGILSTGLEPGVALLLGAVLGLVSTAIYNFTKGKSCVGHSKDYLWSLGIPGLVILALAFGVIVLGIIIALFVIAGLASGGG